MTLTSSRLQNAAIDFVSSDAIVAWEPASRQRTVALMERFADGRLDQAGLRAAFGSDRPKPAAPGPKGVQVLRLGGILTPSDSFLTMIGAGTSLRSFIDQLNQAVADLSIASVLIVVDSPGGLVGMVPEAAAAMRTARARKPVAAAVAGLNASAAYWVTSNTSALYATPSALVGSIGVYTTRASMSRQLQQDGIDVEVFSAGRFKAEGLPSMPISEDERKATQARVDETYGSFVADVAAGRGVSETAVRNGFGEGRIVSAKEAARLGMIDGVQTIEDTIRSTVSGDRALRETRNNEILARLLL